MFRIQAPVLVIPTAEAKIALGVDLQGRRACGLPRDRGRSERVGDRVSPIRLPSLLEVDPKSGGFKRNADHPLDCDLLVVDEASIVDVMLMQALMKAKPDNAAR